MKKYSIVIFYSEDDEAWVANIPDLKYCSAFGSTEEEALREVIIARDLWLSAFEGDGNEAPEAKFDPQLIGA